MQTRQFRSCLSCQRQFLSERAKAKRVEYARRMLESYGSKEDWYHVRFSDETHFGWGPGGRARVLRRPFERDCPDCVQETNELPDEKDMKRVHAWAAVGHNFKSDLVWYNVPSNDNGKMTLKVYRDKILEPVVGQWIRDGHNFVLEEDNDSGHGTGKKNIVKTWKEENGLQSYWNCSVSPDIPAIEKAWQAPKNKVGGQPVYNDETVIELAEEAWKDQAQETINGYVDEIPRILSKIIEGEGKMTAH
ncbi:hypothetical protein RB599_010276 [Gaeumannomyces hyphopodioides]